MKQIGEGIYVQDFGDYRSYLVEAEYSAQIENIISKESAEQEIKIREGAEAETITHYIQTHDYEAKTGKDDVIFVETDDPTHLVKDLCDGGYIDVEQATAIMAYEIEHIRNPDMQRKIYGGKRLKEVREIVIQYKMSALKKGEDARKTGSAYKKDTGKIK